MVERTGDGVQGKLGRRRRELFVGRDAEVDTFRDLIRLSPEERPVVLAVSGLAGMGKTYLLRRFEDLASEAGARLAWTDETQEDVLATMEHIALSLDPQGHAFAAYIKRHRAYRRRAGREGDATAFALVYERIAEFLAQTGVRLARFAPGMGSLLGVVDDGAVASLARGVARTIGEGNDVDLTSHPVRTLSPLFVAGLQSIAGRDVNPIVLFFDTYERTVTSLDPWLRDLLDDTYGALPDNVLLVVAGQHGLNWNNWERYSGVVVRLSLEPLTEATTRAYLSRRGVLDGAVVDDILRRSGRLPLYVAIEAEYAGAPRRARPGEGAIVDRFLGRVDAPMRRQVALDLALPRRFNRDILGVLAEDREDDTIFSWLVEMPFVEEHADGWAYHRVARGPLLRRERGISPQRWADLHSRLATYHAEQQTNRPGDDETRWRDAAWQGHALEAVYHRLCQRPTAYLGAALDGFLAAWDAEYALARRWSETIREAGEDSDDAETSHWGTNLVALINAFDDERYAEAADSLGVLARYGGIEDRRRATALQRRGALLILLGRYASAVDDLTESLRLGADTLDTRQIRSFASWLQGHYDDALADLDHVLAREPDLAFARLLQCLAHLGSGRYADALVDLDQAITSVSEDADHIATMRSLLPALMGHAGEFTLAHAAHMVGQANEMRSRIDEVMRDPYGGTMLNAFQERFAHCLAQANPALAGRQNPMDLSEEASSLVMRGRLRFAVGDDVGTLTAFEDAIALDARAAALISNERGLALTSLGRDEEALEIYRRQLEHDPNNDGILYNIAVATARGQGVAAAQEYIARAQAALRPLVDGDTDARGPALYGIAGLEAITGNIDRALDLLTEALSIDGRPAVLLHRDPAWRELRANPRVQALLRGSTT